MSLPVLTAPPEAPSRSSDTPEQFEAKSDPFVSWFATHVAEQNAYTQALPGAITGTDFKDNSASSVAIGTGDKTFTTSSGKGWVPGQPIRVAYTTTPTNYMDGVVKTYSGTTLVVTVSGTAGSGTYAAWSIGLLPSGSGFATLNGVEVFTNKTLDGNTIANFKSGGFTITVPGVAMTLLGRAETATVTNKSIDFGGNTITMTLAQLNAALSDADVMTLNGAETGTNKTFTAPVINGADIDGASTVDDTGTIVATSVGFRGIPQSANGTNTLALTDNGKAVHTTSNQTIPANASVAFPVGASSMIVNTGGSTLSISITSDTLRWSGTASTGTRTLAAYGQCVIRKISSTVWLISGDIS